MLCNKCHTEIPDNSKFCNHCGNVMQKKWYQKNSPLTITIMIVAFAFLIGAVIFFVNGGFGTSSNEIDLSQYEKIEIGMSYEEVKNIFEFDGELLTSSGENGTEDYYAIYSWNGDSYTSYATITFTGGRVSDKSQYGLK